MKVQTSRYLSIGCCWGPSPHSKNVYLKKIVMAFLRNRPIVHIFHDFRKKLTIFSRLFTHFLQCFELKWLKMCQKIISVMLRPPLWAEIWIFWLKIFFFKNQNFYCFWLNYFILYAFYPIFKNISSIGFTYFMLSKKIWTFPKKFDEIGLFLLDLIKKH